MQLKFTDRKPTFAEARQAARDLFPTWTRRARARWVVAKLKSPAVMLPVINTKQLGAHAGRVAERSNQAA